MRIVYITRTGIGVLGTNASYMIPTMAAKEHDVLVLCPKTPKREQKLIVHQNDQVPVHVLEAKETRERAVEAAAVLEQFDPDIVHVFYHRNAFVYPLIARPMESRPRKWLMDIRTPLLMEPGLSRWAQQARNLLLQFKIDFITSPTRQGVRTVIPICLRPVRTMPIGVDLGEFGLRPRCGQIRLRRFVFVGSIARQRKLEFLVEAFRDFAETVGRSVTLDIFGAGNALDDLRRAATLDGLDDIVRFHGLVDQKQLFARLDQFDAGIAYIPDGVYDHSPALKVLEYAAAGLPIFASDSTANRTFMKEGFHLHLFRNTAQSFTKVLQAKMNQAVPLSRISDNFDRVQAYDWDHIVRGNLSKLYEQMVQ